MENHTCEASSFEHTESIAELEVEDGNKSNEQFQHSSSNLKSDVDESSDDGDDDGPVMCRKRVQRFSDSYSETEKDIVDESNLTVVPSQSEDSIDSNDSGAHKNPPNKSRIRLVSYSDSHSDSSRPIPTKNEEQQTRLKNKRNKIKQKFKSLVSSRLKGPESVNDKLEENEFIDKPNEPSVMSDDEASSIDKIRQKINERTMHLKSTIYDPDTSEEENIPHKDIQKQKKSRKSTKLTSPKPVRMSAKQAMENMQKIKSESNRMLREKEVTLPYHRPKALSLKDIMSRRRPAVSSDGKILPIKMNEDQLKQYVVLLEQRQKDIMELCKSDTEEDEEEEVITDIPNEGINTADMSSNNDTIYDDLIKTTAKETNICDDYVSNPPKISEEIAVYGNLTEKTEGNKSNKDVMISNADYKIENNTPDKGTNNNSNKSASQENKSISGDIITNYIIANTSKDYPGTSMFKGNISAEMELVYNDSVEDTNDNTIAANAKDAQIVAEKVIQVTENSDQHCSEFGTETDSQMISLHYDTEKNDDNSEQLNQLEKVSNELEDTDKISKHIEEMEIEAFIEIENDNFSDDDMNVEDIDKLIENAEILSQTQGDCLNSPMLIRDPQPLNTKPKLIGAPGMIIDLDGTDPFAIKKLTGVELLKERFAYFAKLKTPEEMERDREKRIKPGLQHLKLKQELEEKMAEQRSLEWAERLQEEKRQQMEMDAVRGDGSDAEEDIDKIEAKLEENEDIQKESSSESAEEEEELIEEKEKPRKRNPMIADEAEESDCDEFEDRQPNGEEDNDENDEEVDNDEKSDEESSEEEESDEEDAKRKKGRILKAFEDSDDEDIATKVNDQKAIMNSVNTPSSNTDKASDLVANCASDLYIASNLIENHNQSPVVKGTQDDELQLAQMHKSLSDDLFTSQESDLKVSNGQAQSTNKNVDTSGSDKDLGTQTFSLNPEITKPDVALDFAYPDNLAVVGDTQTYDEGNLDHIVGMCSGSFSQNLVTSQYLVTQHLQSDDIGEDVLALCTGKFYDNQFVSQLDDDLTNNTISQKTADFHNDIEDKEMEQEVNCSNIDGIDNQMNENDDLDGYEKQITEEVIQNDDITNKMTQQITTNATSTTDDKDDNKGLKNYEKNLLSSILDELNDPEFESPKPNKYFVGDDNQDKENERNIANGPIKKKFTIDSDDEGNDTGEGAKEKKKKLKKRKLEERALHISDDDEEDDDHCDQDQEEDEMSEIDDDTERIVEYDSEENEVEIQPEIRKKKRKVTEFFEQEAELSSEEEWAGSGDEDEGGLDRMEREAGDDDTFHQGRLQRELGQIHMRDVLDQDKREVRLIQELLFEDGDLGGGSRQRKFRWRNEDGEEETDTAYKEFADTQEEEFESEEQWRKQRHEREMFLKQMQKQDETEDSVNKSINRTTIIKANLCSKTMSSLLLEVDASTTEKTESPAPEKKTAQDLPSPKKTFTMFQQNSHSSLLARGRGMLARLAALATPLAADDDTPKAGSLAPSSKRNFVFATLTQEEKPKVTKRKADSNVVTPKLVKKMKTEEKQNYPKSSLLDHIKI